MGVFFLSRLISETFLVLEKIKIILLLETRVVKPNFEVYFLFLS